MGHQQADAQNEARSYKSIRKHGRSPRFKSIKEDAHMHKKFGDQARFDRDQMRISHSDCLEHPQRLAEARSALISPRRHWDHIIMINAVNSSTRS